MDKVDCITLWIYDRPNVLCYISCKEYSIEISLLARSFHKIYFLPYLLDYLDTNRTNFTSQAAKLQRSDSKLEFRKFLLSRVYISSFKFHRAAIHVQSWVYVQTYLLFTPEYG